MHTIKAPSMPFEAWAASLSITAYHMICGFHDTKQLYIHSMGHKMSVALILNSNYNLTFSGLKLAWTDFSHVLVGIIKMMSCEFSGQSSPPVTPSTCSPSSCLLCTVIPRKVTPHWKWSTTWYGPIRSLSMSWACHHVTKKLKVSMCSFLICLEVCILQSGVDFSESLVKLLVSVVELSPSVCKTPHILVFLSAYSATLSHSGNISL